MGPERCVPCSYPSTPRSRFWRRKSRNGESKWKDRIDLFGLSDSEDESIVATFDNGEKIKVRYVIGADASHSVVRRLVNLGFADPDGAFIDDKCVRQMVLADVSFPLQRT